MATQTTKQTKENIDADVPSKEKIAEAVFDAVASKRIHKTGYVRHVGGIYPSENDTVAAHLHAVSVIALKLAYEFKTPLKERGIDLDIEKVLRMAIMHDHGEMRSGDTGATSMATFGVCKLHFLERDGLEKSLGDWSSKEQVMTDFDEYREYSKTESLLVHAADVLEGLEKGLHVAYNKPWILEGMLYHVLAENVKIFESKDKMYPELNGVGSYLADNVIISGAQAIFNAYKVKADAREIAEKYAD